MTPAISLAPRVGTITSSDAKRGVPTFIWAHPQGAERSPHTSPGDAARWYLSQFASAYGLRKASLDTVYVSRVHDTGRGGIVVLLRQRVGGVEVIHNQLAVLMRRDLSLVALSGNLHHGAVDREHRFALSGERAAARALGDLYAMDVPVRSLHATKAGGAGHEYFEIADSAPASVALAEPGRVRPVLYPLPDRLVPGYFVEVLSAQGDTDVRGYAYVIGAAEGRVLMRQNRTQQEAFDYRVWADSAGLKTPLDGPHEDYSPHPTGAPDGTAPAYADPIVLSMEGFNTNPDGAADPWLPDGATETAGNNVDAYADISEPDGYDAGADLRAQVTSPGAFAYEFDPAIEPDATPDQIQAAVTQLFYVNNWLHDYYYDSGFDEAAGNAQMDNYGRGGVGNDPLHVQAQDFGGRNNANMTVLEDGLSPRMQMYLWDGATEAAVEAPDGSLQVGVAHFGPKNFDLTAELAAVDDGTDDTRDGCEPLVNTLTGAIAVVDRGNCTFALKAEHAEDAGAVGLIVVNHTAGEDPPGMLNSDPPREITIPALSISLEDGDMLDAAMTDGPVSVTMWRTSDPDRDGTIDNGIVAHEWGHYLHRRLMTSCSSSQCSAQSEGWGDFVALHMMIREGDDYAGVYAVGSYATAAFDNNAYYGIRRVPYSVDPQYNALSLRHVADGEALPTTHPISASLAPNSEVHNAGEIWGTILLEGYVALLDQTLEPDAPYGFAEAQRRMADYVVAGMQLAPVDATFTEQLDAILAAAYASDESDYQLLAEAFARRGAGSCAESPPRYSADFTGVAEDDQVSGQMTIVSVDIDDSVQSLDTDGYVDAGETGRVTITVANTGMADLEGTTVTLSATSDDVTFPGGATAELGALAPYATEEVSIDIAVADGVDAVERVEITATADNADACQSTIAHKSLRPIHADLCASSVDYVDSPQAWTVAGTDVEVWTQAAGPGGDFVWHGADVPLISDAAIESPAIEVGSGDFTVSFEHRYLFEADAETNWDGGVIEISSDGGATWEDISAYVDPGYDGILDNRAGNPLADRAAYTGVSDGWPDLVPVTLDLGDRFAGESVMIRFRVGTDQAVGLYGWDIDNIEVNGAANRPFLAAGTDGVCFESSGGCCQAGTEPPTGALALGILVLLALSRVRRRRRYA